MSCSKRLTSRSIDPASSDTWQLNEELEPLLEKEKNEAARNKQMTKVSHGTRPGDRWLSNAWPPLALSLTLSCLRLPQELENEEAKIGSIVQEIEEVDRQVEKRKKALKVRESSMAPTPPPSSLAALC